MKTLLSILTVITIGLVVAAGVSAKEVPGASLEQDEESSIPYWYYNSPCQQPEGATLQEWLGELPWYGELNLGGWDCSQISAYVEWLTENCGYETVFTCRLGTPTTYGHCWLTIEGSPYEATGLYWINYDTADPGYYAADMELKNIYEAWAHSGEHETWNSASEWAWWMTYPELIEGVSK